MALPVENTANGSRRNSPKPPRRIWTVKEQPLPKPPAQDTSAYRKSASQDSTEAVIVIDNGCSATRAGWSFETTPRLSVPPVSARCRDRKHSRTYTFVGHDAYVDATARGQMKSAFEPGSGVVSNWDVLENVLDYVFLRLGVEGESGGIGRPVVLTEPVANPTYSRKTTSEILFECYSAPSVAYGIDSLFSYRYNEGRTGLVISSSHSATHLIPVVNGTAMLALATRLNWGGQQNADYLLKLLHLKYPNFPGKITHMQAEDFIKEHCYVSQDYEAELSRYLEWTGLEERDHIIQYPFVEQVVVQKSEEELARMAEKRKESGRRLQEQAAKMRLQKLIEKEQELEYYKDLQQQLASATKKDIKRLLESNDFDTEAELEKRVKDLDKSIRKARTKDIGGGEEPDEEVQTYPLVDIPDKDLDEVGIKEKRKQRLAKASVDARARAKQEKESEQARIAEEKRIDEEKRENNLEVWIQERRAAREVALQKIKERQRLKADLGNRKSLASLLRMKSIANLASDNPTSKKRRRGGDDDTFGADDNDWGVYRTIAVNKGEQSDDEDDDNDAAVTASIQAIEAELLLYDPSFTEDHTMSAQSDWTKSLVHAFLRGPWPFDPENTREAHQIHLNVERIRVPEVIFQPSIAGVDQAGIVEIAGNIITQRLGSTNNNNTTTTTPDGSSAVSDEVLKNVFLTGGNTLFQGFDERLRKELQAVLPSGSPLGVRRARDPVLDAWKGAARWAGGSAWRAKAVTREEYFEKGKEYLKEHDLGNQGFSG